MLQWLLLFLLCAILPHTFIPDFELGNSIGGLKISGDFVRSGGLRDFWSLIARWLIVSTTYIRRS